MEFQFDPAKAAGNLRKHGVSFADAESLFSDPLAPRRQRYAHMRPEYDFSKGKRGAITPTKGKTRITIYIDDTVLEEFRTRAEKAGGGYQTMINEALKAHLAEGDERPLTASVLREVIREELPSTRRRKTPMRSTTGPRR